jgi:hypothetical protein
MTTETRALSRNGRAALRYATEYGFSVFPGYEPTEAGCSCGKDCGNDRGKHPRTPNGLLNATRDTAQIERWWRAQPNASVLIRTGAESGIFVVDVDPRHDGADTLHDLEREYGELPETPHSLTGGGGEHIVLKHPGSGTKIRTAAHVLGPGVDIRGDGGYAVFPPSIHPSGRHYEWEGSGYLGEVPIASSPRWILDKAREDADREPVDVAGFLNGVAEGARNDTTWRTACKLRGLNIPYDFARDMILKGASAAAPPYPEKDALSCLDRAYAKYGPNPEITFTKARTVPIDQIDPETLRGHQNGAHGTNGVNGTHAHVADDPTTYHTATPPESFITKYVDYAQQRTDAPPEAHELTAVCMLSALVGPNPWLPIATSNEGWRLTIWGQYIVDSTAGRKTTTINTGLDILRQILDPRAIIEWEGSPQGLIQRLKLLDGQAAIFVRDEYSGLMAQMNKGGHMAGLPQLFIRAFDGGVLENIRTAKRKKNADGEVEEIADVDRVEKPYLVKLTASTWGSFVERASIDNVLDGFLARFAFVTGTATPRRLQLANGALLATRSQLINHAQRIHDRALELDAIGIDPLVLDLQWDLEQAWLKIADESPQRDAMGPALKRLSETVLKVAALIAIDEADLLVPYVRPEHFHMALAMAERWKVSTMKVIETLGQTSFMRDVDAVLAAILRRPGGITLSELFRSHRKLRKRDFDEILATLEDRAQIERVSVTLKRGRPVAVLYPFGKAPQGGPDDGEE